MAAVCAPTPEAPSLSAGPEAGVAAPDKNTQRAILVAVEQWLQTPMGAAACNETTGLVPICDAVSMCAELRELTGGGLAAVAEAVRVCGPGGAVACDPQGRSVRLRGLLDRVCGAAEAHVEATQAHAVSLLDLLRAEAVDALLSGIPETVEQLQTLRDAISLSEVLEVSGSRAVRRKPWPPASEWWTPQAWTMMWPNTEAGSPGGPTATADGHMPWGPGEGVGSDWWPVTVWWPDVGTAHAGDLCGPTGLPGIWQPNKEHSDRRMWICRLVTEVLQNPPAQLAEHQEPDGSVLMARIFQVRPAFATRMYGNPALPVRAIQATPQALVTADVATLTVRLKTFTERLCAACEAALAGAQRAEPTSFGELLMCPAVQAVFADVAASSCEGESTQAARLEQALEASELLEVVQGGPGPSGVALRPASQLLRGAVEAVLDGDHKARAVLAREGELPLTWLAENPAVIKRLGQAGIGGGEASLEVLRAAVELSERYALDGPRMSVRAVGAPAAEAPGAEAAGADSARRWRCVPLEKDAKLLRELLSFYLGPFNLQHNRVLMSVVEAQRRQGKGRGRVGYLRRHGQRPTFRLEDLRALPRVARLLETYEPDGGPCLLAAAVQAQELLPIRICPDRDPGAPRGTWALSDPKLELTYLPNLRFIEATHPSPELRPLYAPEHNPSSPIQSLPPHLLCVVSYSVSSDLSHSQSPKAVDIDEEVTAGTVDPAGITWECRQQKLKRQLLMYDPDVICVQGIQSIGFAERCSEWEPSWFTFEDEPASNHLVHLYRQVSKANYGVTFAPTMKLPGSAVACFGNAVFWKRSRWQLEQRWSIQNTAACAELVSRSSGWRVIACSTRSAATYALEWGDEVATGELLEALQPVQAGLAEAAVRSGARLLWCGDFGSEGEALLAGLDPQPTGVAENGWRSACMSVLREEPWTSAAKHTAGKAVDLILHDDCLKALAVLGGMHDMVDLADILRSGYPSDHLLQLAVFADAAPAEPFVGDREGDVALGSPAAGTGGAPFASSGGTGDAEGGSDGDFQAADVASNTGSEP